MPLTILGEAQLAEAKNTKPGNHLPGRYTHVVAGARAPIAKKWSAALADLAPARTVDPNAVYNNDLTALMWAAGFGKTATVKALLAAGAKPQLKDNRGKTAADMARDEHFDETAAILEAAK